MNHRLPGIMSPLGYITTDPIRFSVKPPSSVYKTIINHLKSLTGIEVLPGLTNEEILAVESSLDFSFPHDLRSILQTGLPVGTNFPNWRTGSTRNHLLLPFIHLSKLVIRNGFWVDTWGIRPENDHEILSVVKELTENAPVLVPVYGDFYVPSTDLSENPVFQIDGDKVRILNCDVAMFLRGHGRSEFSAEKRVRRRRRVEFWSDVAEKGRFVARDSTRCWWSALACEKLRTCLDEAFWKLKEGGWTEEEVRDMMLMDGVDVDTCNLTVHKEISRDMVYAFDNDRDFDTCTVEIDHRKHVEVTTLRHLFAL